MKFLKVITIAGLSLATVGMTLGATSADAQYYRHGYAGRGGYGHGFGRGRGYGYGYGRRGYYGNRGVGVGAGVGLGLAAGAIAGAAAGSAARGY